jgi:hypothetical protein
MKDKNTGITNRFYSLYDKEDEREAFARGRLLGSSETFEGNAFRVNGKTYYNGRIINK